MTTSYKGPRHTSISTEPRTAAQQNAENARDTLQALAARPLQRVVTVEMYTATGSISTRIRLAAATRPIAVQLARAAKYYAQDESLAATGNGNFVWDSTTNSVDVFEPSGLTTNTVYVLTFLITE
jgi:hypothetical protein